MTMAGNIIQQQQTTVAVATTEPPTIAQQLQCLSSPARETACRFSVTCTVGEYCCSNAVAGKSGGSGGTICVVGRVRLMRSRLHWHYSVHLDGRNFSVVVSF